MLKLLTVTFLVSIFCHHGCAGGPNDTVGAPEDIGWQTWLLVDPGKPREHMENEKKRRITPKSVFIAPAFSGTSHLPDCADGYRPDSMGRCVKLVQLNHEAQLDFLLQRLNAMYAAPPVRRGSGDDMSASDSSPSGPFQVPIPIDIPQEPEQETEESVEVAVVMADVLKDNRLIDNNKRNETKESQSIVAVWNVGKNGTSLEEIESSSDLENESEDLHFGETDLKLITSNDTKYKIVNKSENSTDAKTSSKVINQTLEDTIKSPYSALGLLEEVSNVSSEDGRSGNTSRRNVSGNRDSAESIPITTEAFVITAVTKRDSFAGNVHASLPEIPVTREIEPQLLPASTYRPRTFVRFPSENSPVSVDNNEALSNGVFAGRTRNRVKFPQTHFGFQKPGSLLPSDVQQRQTFWWLPTGWRLDPTRHQPMLITFWARMPLLRDHHFRLTDSHQITNAGRRRGPLVY